MSVSDQSAAGSSPELPSRASGAGADAKTDAAADAAAEPRNVNVPILCVIAFAIGIVAAVGAVIFRYLIAISHNLFFYGRFGLVYDANQFEEVSTFGPMVILAPVVGGLIVVFLVKTFAPEAKGHGVPEVMFAIYHKNGDVRGVVAIVKSLASAISIGSGASVGREGPIIQIGSSFGSTIARILNLSRWQKVTLLASGAGAGIAATFNTPLGGVLFAVELLLPEVSSRTFLPVVVATATATYVARITLGLDPAFIVPIAELPVHEAIGVARLVAFAILGVLAGLASWAFIRTLAWCEDIFPKLPGNEYTQNIVGMLIIGVLGYAFFVTTGHYHVYGVGYASIQDVLNATPYTLVLLLALLLAKIVATSVSLGAGASGGVFSPSLFIGATLGGAVGLIGMHLLPGEGFTAVEFALVGMGALVGGATGAAMTAIVMIFEMTRDYNVIVPLVLAVAIAVGVRRWLVSANIYTIKLRNRGKPIPSNRHTNMYLVRPASDIMTRDFLVMPIDTPLEDALKSVSGKKPLHIIATDGNRIAGYVYVNSVACAADRFGGQTLQSLISYGYVIARPTDMLNTIITRMNLRSRNYAIITSGPSRVPRPDDVVGIVDRTQIADAVISNHYV